MQDARWLSERGEPEAAREKLDTLNKQFPREPEILIALLDVLFELKDFVAYQAIAEQAVEVVPDDPDLFLNYARSHATNLHPVSALRAFRQFLARFPNHPSAPKVRDGVAELEANLPNILADIQLDGPRAEEAALLHERVLALLARADYPRARKALDELLILAPDFVPALNNSSTLYFLDGDLARAVEVSRRALTREPQNVQALSNLTRLVCLQGDLAQAQALAAQLVTLDSARADAAVKQIEALAILGQDARILEIFERAEKRGDLQEPFVTPWIFHAAGVAALRLGDERRAKKLWQRALEVAPTFEITRANLDDLKKPRGEQHVPRAFTLAEWVPRKTVNDLAARLQPALRGQDATVERAMQRFLRDHPETLQLVPLLLDHGDPQGREFALHIARVSNTPAAQTALRDFALGPRGPDALRMQAAQAASRAGLIPQGAVKMYLRGAWTEVLLLDLEITDEPALRLKPATQKLFEQSAEALRQLDGARAETLLRQALALEPHDESLTHNLAMALEIQHRRDECEALVRENHARHPDYLFARVALAHYALQKKLLAEAQALLEPLATQKRFHITEFAAYAGAQIDLALTRGEKDAANSWLELWASIDPEHPHLAQYRLRLTPLGRFFGR